MFRLRVWQPKQNMSEAGCSMGHSYKPLVTNWMKTSHSLRIHGEECMEPRGTVEVREKIFPRCDSLRLCRTQCGPDQDSFLSLGWAMRTAP